MKLQKKIEKQLSLEFAHMRPKLLMALIWFAIGENKDKSSEDILRNMGQSPHEIPDKKEQERFIYDVFIRLARETCQDAQTVKHIDRIITEIESSRAKKLQATQHAWNEDYSTKSNQNSFFASAPSNAIESRKRPKEKPEKHVSFAQDKGIKKPRLK